MGRSRENAGFVCAHCDVHVVSLTNGSYRNHCPACLYSRHVDVGPGDRASRCGGLMAPVRLLISGKGWRIVHRCLDCGLERPNRVAEATLQPDSIEALIALSLRGSMSKHLC